MVTNKPPQRTGSLRCPFQHFNSFYNKPQDGRRKTERKGVGDLWVTEVPWKVVVLVPDM